MNHDIVDVISKIVIAAMGPTGPGKSSFVNNLSQDESIKVGHSLHSGES